MTTNCGVKFRACVTSDNCYNEDSETIKCWIIFYIQLALGLFLIVGLPSLTTFSKWICSMSSRRFNKNGDDVSNKGEESSHNVRKEESSTRTPKARKPSPQGHRLEEVVEGNEEESSNSSFDVFESNPSKSAVEAPLEDFPFTQQRGSTIDVIGDSKTTIKKEQTSSTIELLDEVIIQDSPFTLTHRSENNFLMKNDDPDIEYPNAYPPEYTLLERGGFAIVKHTFESIRDQKQFRRVLVVSSGLSLLTGSLTSLVAMAFRYEEEVAMVCPESDHIHFKMWVSGNINAIGTTLDGYKFFPVFLLLAYTAFLVDRWRNFLVVCHSIQGRIHDIGLLCGSSPDLPVSEGAKRKLYTIYRYLNMVHILCLRSFSPSLKNMNLKEEFVTELGLLTPEEAELLTSMENKARDGTLTLLAHATSELLSELSSLEERSSKMTVVNTKICDLRASCAKLHDLFIRDNPNEYVMFMNTLICMYTILIVIGYPFLLLSFSDEGIIGCLQPGALFGSFFIILSISIPSALFVSLQNPFDSEGDGIVVDSLMASSDLCLFQNLRVLLHLEPDLGRSNDNKRASLVADLRDSPFVSKRAIMRNTTKGGFGEL
jgi:hypothetical protein